MEPAPPLQQGGSSKRVPLSQEDAETQLFRELRVAAHTMLLEQERLVKSHLERLLEARRQPAQDDAAGSDSASNPPPPPAPMPTVLSPRVEQEPEPEAAQRRPMRTTNTKILEAAGRSWKASFDLIQSEEEKKTSCGGLVPKIRCAQRAMRLYEWWSRIREPIRSGPLARVVLSSKFEMLTLAMIMFNGVLILWQTDANARIAATEPHLLHDGLGLASMSGLIEAFFIVFFAVELVLKLLVHRLYFFCNSDMWWNIFDAVTVVSAIVDMAIALVTETGESPDVTFLRVLRIFRLTRSLRMMRALHFVKSLRQLMDCIVASFSNLFWCMVLLVFLTGLFAVFLVQIATNFWSELHISGGVPDEDTNEELVAKLGSIISAMLSLLMCTTGGEDWGYYYTLLRPTGLVGPGLLVAYVLFFIVAAWNIVTSLFIEKALALAQPDVEEQMLLKRRQDFLDAKDLLQFIQTIDTDQSGTISLQEFQSWMTEPSFRAFFEVRNIDIKDAELFFHMLEVAAGTEDVDIKLVVNGLMRMRGVASNLDVQVMNFHNMVFFNHVDKWIRALKADIQHVATDAAFAATCEKRKEEQLHPCTSEGSGAARPGKRSQAMDAVQSDIEKLSFADLSRTVQGTTATDHSLNPNAGGGSAPTSVRSVQIPSEAGSSQATARKPTFTRVPTIKISAD